MNEHTPEHQDPDLEFQRPEDNDEGQDYYAGQETDAEYADPAAALEEKPKLNPMIVNIAIFGGIGIFALVMAWVNFGSVLFPKTETTASNAPTNSAALLSPVAAPAAQPVVAPPSGPTTAATGTASPTDLSATAAGSTPTTTNPADPNAAPTDVAALSVTPGAPITPPPATPNNNPSATASVIPAPTATQPIATAPLAPTQTPGQTSGAMAAVATPPMQTAPVLTPAAPPVDNSKLVELQQQNQDLTAKNAEQESALNDLRSQLSDAQAKLADLQTKMAEAEAKPKTAAAPAPKKIVKKQSPVHHVAKAATSDSTAAALPSTGPASGATASASGYLGDTLPAPPPYWVLRSAADNSAWVAHPGDSQLYQVTVGDQLPGIGKIISIQQQSGDWVVVGTQGQIRQP